MESVSEEPIVATEKSGWADSMLKIAKPSKKKAECPILGEFVGIKRVKKEEKDGSEDESSDEDEDSSKSGLRKQEKFNRGKQKPDVLAGPRERVLAKIATRGVVQLFNAVKKYQGSSSTDEFSDKKTFNSVNKDSFLKILSGGVKEES